MNEKTEATTIRLPCACANLRRADRVVTRYYDAMLRPSGLHTTQFTLLQALHLVSEVSQKRLAELLEIDSTTLTRTLAPLNRKGWLRSQAAEDRRELRLSLTAAGKREYQRVLPYWQKAQRGMQQTLGTDAWNQLVQASVQTAQALNTTRPVAPFSTKR